MELTNSTGSVAKTQQLDVVGIPNLDRWQRWHSPSAIDVAKLLYIETNEHILAICLFGEDFTYASQ